MTRTRDLEALGAAHRKSHQGFLPDFVRKSGGRTRRKASEALGDGNGWLSRLAMAGKQLEHHTVHLSAFKLEHLEGEENLYDHQAVNTIKQAVLEAMPGTFRARLEVGKEGRRRLHVHILAHQAPIFAHQVPKVAHVIRPVTDLKGMGVYMYKCPVPENDNLSAGIYLEGKKQARLKGYKRLPKTAFSRGIPQG